MNPTYIIVVVVANQRPVSRTFQASTSSLLFRIQTKSRPYRNDDTTRRMRLARDLPETCPRLARTRSFTTTVTPIPMPIQNPASRPVTRSDNNVPRTHRAPSKYPQDPRPHSGQSRRTQPRPRTSVHGHARPIGQAPRRAPGSRSRTTDGHPAIHIDIIDDGRCERACGRAAAEGGKRGRKTSSTSPATQTRYVPASLRRSDAHNERLGENVGFYVTASR